MSETEKLFIESVGTRDVDAVLEYVSDVSTEILKRMKLIAKRKQYYDIVEIIDNELATR